MMQNIPVSDLENPLFDLAEFLPPSPEQAIGAILSKRVLSAEDFQHMRIVLTTAASTAPHWFIHPRTLDAIKLAHNFPEPIRKLRKVQLRRIAQRKKLYRKHRAQVNVAILERVRAGGAS